jgi:hypothetical protein
MPSRLVTGYAEAVGVWCSGSGDLDLVVRVAIRDPRVLVGTLAGPIYLPPAPGSASTQASTQVSTQASTHALTAPARRLQNRRKARAARLRMMLRLVGAASLSAAATASVVVAAITYEPAQQAASEFDRQIPDRHVTMAVRQPAVSQHFADRWGQAEFADMEPSENVATSFQKPVKTLRFERPATQDDPVTTASVPARPRFPVAYSLASADARQVDIDKPADLLGKQVAGLDEVSQYLWEVYQRVPTKRDGAGDFTWKDPMAAKRVGMALPKYVIGGMDPDFREQLFHAGRAMDAAGIKWSILSAFRDDYRQRIASGIKASARNSLHGGSARTGGYGHGQAVDVTGVDDEMEVVWRWLDANGAKYGLHRPMPGYDPAHVQPRGDWRKLAASLRQSRIKLAQARKSAPDEAAATRLAARVTR